MSAIVKCDCGKGWWPLAHWPETWNDEPLSNTKQIWVDEFQNKIIKTVIDVATVLHIYCYYTGMLSDWKLVGIRGGKTGVWQFISQISPPPLNKHTSVAHTHMSILYCPLQSLPHPPNHPDLYSLTCHTAFICVCVCMWYKWGPSWLEFWYLFLSLPIWLCPYYIFIFFLLTFNGTNP